MLLLDPYRIHTEISRDSRLTPAPLGASYIRELAREVRRNLTLVRLFFYIWCFPSAKCLPFAKHLAAAI